MPLNIHDTGDSGHVAEHNRIAWVRQASDIQAAITALAADGGGVIQLGPGVFTVTSTLNLKDGVSIRGQGRNVTTIAADTGVSTALLLGSSEDSVSDVTISDLTLNGGHGTVSVLAVQITNGSRIIFDRVAVTNCSAGGVLLDTCPDSTITGCIFDGAGLNDVSTAHSITIQNGSHRYKVIGNDISGGLGMGVSVALTACTDGVIQGNSITVEPSTTGFEGIGVTGAHIRCAVVGNVIQNAQDNGISVSSDQSTITGNTVDTTENHGIAVNDKAVVTGNYIRNVGGAYDEDGLAYGGVECDGGCVIVGNVCVDDRGGSAKMGYGVKVGGSDVVASNLLSGYRIAETDA